MLSAKCPGQDRRNWKPEDIFDYECPHCSEQMEFFKTDAKRNCPGCGEPVLNPRFNLGCALWCSFAEHCVGDISGIFTERPEALRDKLEIEVRRYFYGAKKRLQLTLEAADVASNLLEGEKEADPPVVIAALLLHDVGYTSCQEVENADQADCIRQKNEEIGQSIMKNLKLPEPVQEKVVELITQWDEKSKSADEDLNRQLFEDALEIARLRLERYGESLPDGEKDELLARLYRENSRRYAEKAL